MEYGPCIKKLLCTIRNRLLYAVYSIECVTFYLLQCRHKMLHTYKMAQWVERSSVGLAINRSWVQILLWAKTIPQIPQKMQQQVDT